MLRMARRFWAWGIVRGFTTQLEVRGAGQLDPETTYLFVSNHLSHLDVPVLMRAVPFGVRFFAKHQLRAVPLLGRFIRTSGMVFVPRGSPRQAKESLSLLTAKLRSRQSFVAFPEGSRSRSGQLATFKLGPFKAAIAAGVPVVPVSVVGTNKAWPAGGLPNRRGCIRVGIGQPISTEGMTKDATSSLCRAAHLVVRELSFVNGSSQR